VQALARGGDRRSEEDALIVLQPSGLITDTYYHLHVSSRREYKTDGDQSSEK
jgi:hypothetical protein